jgi:hypothetical protein
MLPFYKICYNRYKNERCEEMKNTEERMHESKERALSKASEILDAYYKKYEDAGEERSLTINHVERFLMDCKDDIDKALSEASSDILKGMEEKLVEKKQSAPDARVG